MQISQVVGTLYCTERIAGLRHCSLRVLKDLKGKLVVATDPVGTRPGNWVFTVEGSAGRYAMGDPDIMTDLTIGGIIDAWAPETVAKPAASNGAASAMPRDKAA
ncbi:MAG: carboxysome peptide B [Halochromatium sp.]|uniref:carboxysome peptide B n=1 Tax=Halochromatium sp. TaxID=2049430 RepID=UPI003978FDE4